MILTLPKLSCLHLQFRVLKMKLKGIYLFSFALFLATVYLGDASGSSQPNKHIIKSIKSEDGDVIDCVDIYRQPAFDHPLLKNHTIKVKPSYYPEGVLSPDKLSNTESNGDKKQITQLWQLSGECPEGTIPIRRTEKQTTSMKKKHFKINKPATNPPHEYAYTETQGQGNYYGTQCIISVWTPFVETNHEFSLSQLWLVGGSGSNVNTIEVGWTVDPEIYPDNRTRLFVYWTRDHYESTGCYDLKCPGFVQTTNQMAIGATVSTSGNYPEITLLVWKDEQQQVWWLNYNGNIVGYWPNSIFTVLKGSASLVQWGGEIVNSRTNGVHTRTQMGSGQFPQAGFGKASYFRNLLVVNNANTLVSPGSTPGIATNPYCYNVTVGQASNWGNYFFYGGPGKNPNCP